MRKPLLIATVLLLTATTAGSEAAAPSPKRGAWFGQTSIHPYGRGSFDLRFRVGRRGIRRFLAIGRCTDENRQANPGGGESRGFLLLPRPRLSRGRISGKHTGRRRIGDGDDGRIVIVMKWTIQVSGRFTSSTRARGAYRYTLTFIDEDAETGATRYKYGCSSRRATWRARLRR